MPITNREIAETFEMIADMLQIKGESVHRVLAYRRAAETIAELPRDINAIYADGKLEDIDGIGQTLAEKIEEMITTGKLAFYEKLSAEVPEGVVDVMRIQGVGPKKAKLFWQKLDIIGVEMLRQAAEAGKLRDLPGMGAKSEANVLEGIAALARQTGRARLGDAYPLAQRVLASLMQTPGAEHGEVAGSVRRRRPTIGDLDLLIASRDPQPLMDAFVTQQEVVRVLGHGETKSSVELVNGQQADLRVLPPERYGTLLVYFTGSKDHNVRLRELALRQGLSLNEHAFTPVDAQGQPTGAPEITCATEEQVYEVLSLPWIAPELREDRGEIEAAREGRLPSLITLADMRCDLHMHSTWSDGKNTILEMARAALERGRHYIMITDHSPGLGMIAGLQVSDIPAQRAEIDAAQRELGDAIRILHGCEVEIKADGTLDYDDATLAQFDMIIASLHTSLRQPREQITARLIRAISNPYVRIIAHPRGQQLPQREPADLDMDAVYAAALEHDTALEINANPRRLDLDDVHARRAHELGVKLTINSDAHAPEQMDLLQYGIWTARRGWVEPQHVINTWPLDDMLAWAAGHKS